LFCRNIWWLYWRMFWDYNIKDIIVKYCRLPIVLSSQIVQHENTMKNPGCHWSKAIVPTICKYSYVLYRMEYVRSCCRHHSSPHSPLTHKYTAL
jgi:hypothetical protein